MLQSVEIHIGPTAQKGDGLTSRSSLLEVEGQARDGAPSYLVELPITTAPTLSDGYIRITLK